MNISKMESVAAIAGSQSNSDTKIAFGKKRGCHVSLCCTSGRSGNLQRVVRHRQAMKIRFSGFVSFAAFQLAHCCCIKCCKPPTPVSKHFNSQTLKTPSCSLRLFFFVIETGQTLPDFWQMVCWIIQYNLTREMQSLTAAVDNFFFSRGWRWQLSGRCSQSEGSGWSTHDYWVNGASVPLAKEHWKVFGPQF